MVDELNDVARVLGFLADAKAITDEAKSSLATHGQGRHRFILGLGCTNPEDARRAQQQIDHLSSELQKAELKVEEIIDGVSEIASDLQRQLDYWSDMHELVHAATAPMTAPMANCERGDVDASELAGIVRVLRGEMEGVFTVWDESLEKFSQVYPLVEGWEGVPVHRDGLSDDPNWVQVVKSISNDLRRELDRTIGEEAVNIDRVHIYLREAARIFRRIDSIATVRMADTGGNMVAEMLKFAGERR